jgi:hypothetical protein
MKIYPNKKEAIKALVGTSFALLIFTFFAFFDLKDLSAEISIVSVKWFYWFYKSFCVIMIFILALAIVFFIKTLARKKPIIEIDEMGLTDNSSIISLGFIPWSDMERACLQGAFFTISLKQPEEYLRRAGAIKRLLIKSNLKMGYGQVCISPILISHKIKEFLYAFAEYHSIEDCDFLSK